MKKAFLAVAVAATMPASYPSDSFALSDKDKKAIIAGAILLGAAAAAASSHDHRHEYHRNAPQNYYRPPGPFHPRPNITCYPAERSCYRDNGRYAPRWTQQYFGY